MASILLSIFFSTIVSLIILGIVTFYTDNICFRVESTQTAIQVIVFVSAFIIIFIISCFGISYGLSMYSKENIAEYQAQKITIEQSLSNEELSGLERIELVKQASELNGWLASQKVTMSKWTEFDIYKSVREEYQRAEYIDLGVE